MRISLHRLIGLLSLTILMLPILAACGGDDGGQDAAQQAPADTSTGGVQAQPVSLAPEIGSIDNWYNGGATSLEALRGKPVLLVFWADY